MSSATMWYRFSSSPTSLAVVIRACLLFIVCQNTTPVHL